MPTFSEPGDPPLRTARSQTGDRHIGPEEIATLFPSFRDFVDDALFHPEWGYYSTGRVRFGDGGHFDTFPSALSPLFGRIVARYAFRLWQRMGEPQDFEIAEIGAGNGQLCLDALLAARESTRREPAWRRFVERLRYRILERSPGLIARQRAQLAGAGLPVLWSRLDLSRGRPRRAPFGSHGLIVANEVLDCLAHHKVVVRAGQAPAVVFVVASVRAAGATPGVRLPGITGRALSRAALAALLRDPQGARKVRFHERQLPLSVDPELARFLDRYCSELFEPRRAMPPYFACPSIPLLLRNSAALYSKAEALWIDYGHQRPFHLRAAENRKLFAGPPHSGHGPYQAPGADDITFMVDFTTVALAAVDAGWQVEFYGPQGELARRAGVHLGGGAEETVLTRRGLKWLLALTGVDPEGGWRAGSISFKRAGTRGGSVRADVKRAIDEFSGRSRSPFKLMILRRGDG